MAPTITGLGRHNHPLDRLGGLTTSEDAISSPSPKWRAFKRWIKLMWLDVLCLCITAAYGYVIFIHKTPLTTRLFPLKMGDQVVYPELAYPQRTELFPTFYTTLVSFGIPFFFLCFMQIFVRSFWDWNNAILGLFYSMIGASVFQVTIKMLIGGLRPHFLSVCQPVPGFWDGQGYGMLMYDRRVCTGDPKEIDDAMTSFPSGHAAGACAGFIYLALYINGRVKPFTRHRTHFWKLVIVMIPMEIAFLLSAAKCVDEWHNWYDVLVGGLIGTMFAYLAYRSVFAATWDPRYNHVPLMGDEEFETPEEKRARGRKSV